MSKEGEEIIFYDIPTKEPRKTWSLNPWKTRLVLNYKKLPYRTEWVEYPDLRPTLSKLVPAREGVDYSTDEYTSPAITLPTKPPTHIMDSLSIAQALETQYPTSPSLHLDSPTLQRATDLVVGARGALVPIFMPLVPRTFLSARSAEYFHRTREQRINRTLDELYDDPEIGGAKAWEAAGEKGLKQLAALYRENADKGPFLMGKEPSYGDFVVVGQMKMMEGLGVLEEYLKASGGGGELRGVFEACRPWLERDDH